MKIGYEELKWKRRQFANWKKSAKGKRFIKKLFKKQNGKCAITGLKMFVPKINPRKGFKIYSYSALYWKMMTVDHIVPLSEGGQNVESNYRLVTRASNLDLSRKNPRHLYNIGVSKTEIFKIIHN